MPVVKEQLSGEAGGKQGGDPRKYAGEKGSI
jgi:hypothetical protein